MHGPGIGTGRAMIHSMATRNLEMVWPKEIVEFSRTPVGERILRGVHGGAYCAHYLCTAAPDKDHRVFRLQNDRSVRNSDGTLSTVWENA